MLGGRGEVRPLMRNISAVVLGQIVLNTFSFRHLGYRIRFTHGLGYKKKFQGVFYPKRIWFKASDEELDLTI